MPIKKPSEIWPDVKAIMELEKAGLLTQAVARQKVRMLMRQARLPMTRRGSLSKQLQDMLAKGHLDPLSISLADKR